MNESLSGRSVFVFSVGKCRPEESHSCLDAPSWSLTVHALGLVCASPTPATSVGVGERESIKYLIAGLVASIPPSICPTTVRRPVDSPQRNTARLGATRFWPSKFSQICRSSSVHTQDCQSPSRRQAKNCGCGLRRHRGQLCPRATLGSNLTGRVAGQQAGPGLPN